MFKLKEHNTNVKTEIIGGLTTFFAMSYIIFVNPGLLGLSGMDFTGVAVATCISAVIGTLLTGLIANVPFAQAPGMGLNAFFTFTCCFAMGFTWQETLAIVLISGIIFLVIAISPLRKKLISAIPASLKCAIAAGIGLFIALIGLCNSGLIGFGSGVPALEFTASLEDGTTVIKDGVILTLVGLVITTILMVLKVKGGLFVGIIITAIIGIVPSVCGLNVFGSLNTANASYDIASIGKLSEIAFKLDFKGLFANHGILPIITAVFSFGLVDCFDTVGTLIGTAQNNNMVDENGNLDGGDKALIADAVATCIGACLGTSTVTTYVESSSGIAAGARTGLSSVVTAAMFALAILITPFFQFLSDNAWLLYAMTSPALVIVGVLMMSGVSKIDWTNMDEAIPSFLTIAMMPFAYSISDGIAFGFIAYAVIKLVKGKGKDTPILVYIASLLFIAKYILSVI